MECRIRSATTAAQVRQPHPRLERPRRRSLARRDPPAPRDQQLPRVHRAAVPGAVRGPACVLEIREGDAVTIKQIENAIIDRAWEEGWVASPPSAESGFGVAVVGAPRRGWRPRSPSCAARAHRSCCSLSATKAASGLDAVRRARLQDREVGRRRRVQQLRDEASRSLRRRRRGGRDGRGAAVGVRRGRALHQVAVRATCRCRATRLEEVRFAMDYLYEAEQRWVADGSSPSISAARRTSSSSAAATPARTASPTPTAARCRSRSSSCCPSRPAPRRSDAVAAVAAEVPAVVRDGGRRRRSAGRAGLLRRDDALLG